MIRRPVPWPNGAKVAVAITFDMDADSLVHLAHPSDSITRISTISMLRYGPEVAVPRILEGYRRYGLKQTFFVPAWCIEQYPHAVEAIVKDGHEVGFHGYIHEAAERAVARGGALLDAPVDRGHREAHRQTARAATDRRSTTTRSTPPTFWSTRASFTTASLMGDDVPYILKTEKGEIVELPSSWALDDWPPYVHPMDLDYMFQIVSPDRAMETFMAEFEAMRHCRRRIVDRRLASLRERPAVAMAPDRKDDRIHAWHGRGLVRDARGDCRPHPGAARGGRL